MNENVDEYPAPPAYFRVFTSDRSNWPNPPEVIRNHIPYGGSIVIQSIEEQSYDPKKDYLKELHKYIGLTPISAPQQCAKAIIV